MRVKIRLFARLRELAGAAELGRDVPAGATVGSVWRLLAAEFPGFDPYERAIACAVNGDYARKDYTLQDGDEIAFLPPVSGGEPGRS